MRPQHHYEFMNRINERDVLCQF